GDRLECFGHEDFAWERDNQCSEMREKNDYRALPSGSKSVDSPLRMSAARIRRGRPFTSAMILAMYSPTTPTAKRLSEPNIRIRICNVVRPLGARPGKNKCRNAITIAVNVESPSSITPNDVSIVSGALENEKMPFFAQSMFLIRLLVDRPNMRSGRV